MAQIDSKASLMLYGAAMLCISEELGKAVGKEGHSEAHMCRRYKGHFLLDKIIGQM